MHTRGWRAHGSKQLRSVISDSILLCKVFFFEEGGDNSYGFKGMIVRLCMCVCVCQYVCLRVRVRRV